MLGEGGEGVGWSDACAAGQKSNFRRWSCRAGRGAESQQQPEGALSCKAFWLLFVFCGGDAGRVRGESVIRFFIFNGLVVNYFIVIFFLGQMHPFA